MNRLGAVNAPAGLFTRVIARLVDRNPANPVANCRALVVAKQLGHVDLDRVERLGAHGVAVSRA